MFSKMYLQPVFIVILIQLVAGCNGDVKQLEAVHVVFRHGDRTPDSGYTKDPYINETYDPVGLGQLTNAGKQRAYEIGLNLRRRYGSIISETYSPGILYAISSHYPRCKATIQAVLAGLFPPKGKQVWNNSLAWQPIPFDAYRGNNKMFTSMLECQKFGRYLGEYFSGKSLKILYPKYYKYVQYILDNTGLEGSGVPMGLIGAHSTIKSQQEWGLDLPKWSRSVWPKPLTALAVQSWKHWHGSQQLRIINGGYILSSIMNNTYSKINQDKSFKNTTMFIYSGHDMTVASLLAAFGNLDLEYVDYGSQILIEIHNIKGHRYVKLLYENHKKGDPRVLRVPGCGELCAMEKFTKIIADYLDPVLFENTCN